MPNWRNPADYLFIEKSRPELIAWEFLRRNPDYQQDYHWFITTWNKLEKKYGAPPNRDFDSWKKDPQAYRAENDSELDDKLLIECWMGTKWGFYKFPIDPIMDNPMIGKDLTWRTPLVTVTLFNDNEITKLTTNDLKNKTAILFDLGKDLKQQLQSAKQKLIVAQKNNSTSGNLQNWILYLRFLDAINDAASKCDIQNLLKLTQEEFTIVKTLALNIRSDHYRELVTFI